MRQKSYYIKPEPLAEPASCGGHIFDAVNIHCHLHHCLPYGVKNIPILEYPEKFVVRCDFMKMGALLIGEEKIWLPYGIQHGGIQVKGVIWVLSIGQSGVVPLLPQEDVHTVVLEQRPAEHWTMSLIWHGYYAGDMN